MDDLNTDGSLLDYVKTGGGLATSIISAINSGGAADANKQAAQLNAAAAAAKANAEKTKASNMTKIAIIGGVVLVVVVILISAFRKK
ncbi:MAG: hypothetical protein U1F65_05755 [Verrucomicrobiota bacterium]